MKALLRGWARFWYTPEPTSTLALLRVAYGVLLLAWTLMLSFNASAFFSRSGILPEGPDIPWAWSLLDAAGSDVLSVAVLWLLVAAAVCLVLGFHTRLAAVVAFVVMVSLHRRNPWVFQAGDTTLRIFSFYFMFTPAGTSLSLDRWRRARSRFWDFPERQPWGLRLIQLQLSVLYLFSVATKLVGATWREGTAVSYALRIGELIRLQLPSWITESLLVSRAATWATLVLELALAVLVWNRRARPWVLAAGVVFHLILEVTMRVGFFSLTMLVYYVAFLDPMAARQWLLALRRRLQGSGVGVLHRLGTAGSEGELAPESATPVESLSALPAGEVGDLVLAPSEIDGKGRRRG